MNEPPKEVSPGTKSGATTTSPNARAEHSRATDAVADHRRRRRASYQLRRLDCDCCRDPHTTRHRPGPAPWGYRDAAEHLAALGLLAALPDDVQLLREMWRDDRTRALAGEISAAWGLVG